MERGGRRRARPGGANRLASDRAELWEGSPGRAGFICAGPSSLKGRGASSVPTVPRSVVGRAPSPTGAVLALNKHANNASREREREPGMTLTELS